MSSAPVSLPELLINGPGRAACTIVLAHGAGAPMDTDFMNAFAGALADRDLRVVRFEFPYMAARRNSGKRRPQDRAPLLRDVWTRVVDSLFMQQRPFFHWRRPSFFTNVIVRSRAGDRGP